VETHDPDEVARELGFINLGPVGNLDKYFLFQAQDHVYNKRDALEKAVQVNLPTILMPQNPILTVSPNLPAIPGSVRTPWCVVDGGAG